MNGPVLLWVLEKLLDVAANWRAVNGTSKEKAPDLRRLYPGGRLVGGRIGVLVGMFAEFLSVSGVFPILNIPRFEPPPSLNAQERMSVQATKIGSLKGAPGAEISLT